MASRKTFTFAIMHMSVAFAIVYLMTGSLAIGGAVAMIEPAINTIAYFLHEKFWERPGRSARDEIERDRAPPACPFAGLSSPALDPALRCKRCRSRASQAPIVRREPLSTGA